MPTSKTRKILKVGFFVLVGLVATYLFAVSPFLAVRSDAERIESVNHLKLMMGAIHEYHDKHKQLPPVAIRDSNGNPLLSWRVALLPYLGEEALYKQFKLDEPWDSSHNIQLLEKMPEVYYFRGQAAPNGMTHFQVFTGPGTAFERDGLNLPKDFPDGTYATLFIVEARDPVPWTKPQDLVYDPDKPLPPLGLGREKRTWLSGNFMRGEIVLGAFGDGTVRSFWGEIKESSWRKLITRNGGEEPDKE